MKRDRKPADAVSAWETGEDVALRTILEGTATTTGEGFFRALVESLSRALGSYGAWVTTYDETTRTLDVLAIYMGGRWTKTFSYSVEGTPCEDAIDGRRFLHIPDKAFDLYPGEGDFANTGALSYMGVPLVDLDGRVLGLLALLDTEPMPEEPRSKAIFHIFAARAAAELQRLRAESEVREREERLGRLVDSAMDAIVELDKGLAITRMNPAAEKAFGSDREAIRGKGFGRFVSPESRRKLTDLANALDDGHGGVSALWVPGGLTAQREDGRSFPAEATLSRYEMDREPFYTLILRNVNDQEEAERKIRNLTQQTEYLQEELSDFTGTGEIAGRSPAIRRVHKEVAEVAGTNATVLILGETGTGKELVGRAIHRASARGDAPLIKVNCAAIPANLIESEFFGHEKGAFTGATQKREGRFALADGGTIFLDEVGELPLDLQSKLLRVLQEGEFEPLGSSKTRKVDVRVIAATNRDLKAEAQKGTFREDLYYRLNVFPIEAPPLRERGEDVCLLADLFARRYASRIGRAMAPLSARCRQRLAAYPWPGNVRELQNVIERAVITSTDGHLNLDRALPGAAPAPATAQTGGGGPDPILTAAELQRMERDNLKRALEACGWRVSGKKGAAVLLGMNPSTLTSRIKALGLEKPNA